MALVDTVLYLLSQNSTSAMFSLISSMVYFLLSLLQIGLIPICLAAAIFFWVERIVGGRVDGRSADGRSTDGRSADLHSWISLSLIVLTLVWAVAKIVFLAGELGV